MGVMQNVSYDKFPKQSDQLYKATKVCFKYDTLNMVDGIIVRDDLEAPFITIIKLGDGRYINSTECQYTFPK